MLALHIDETFPTLINYLPQEILEGIITSPCCRCGCEYGRGTIIMYVDCGSKTRWWHYGDTRGICIEKADTLNDLKEVIHTRILQSVK